MAVPAEITFNCGYARSAIREISLKETGNNTDQRTKRSQIFQELFGRLPGW